MNIHKWKNREINRLLMEKFDIPPGEDPIYPASGETDSVIVQPGDTLWGIAKDRGVTIDDLMKHNDLESDVIRPGQEIFIPREEYLGGPSEEELDEDMASEAGHIVLDIAGMVPVLGEYPDIANAAWYVTEAEKYRREDNGYEASFAYLFALLSVASLAGAVAPIIGDLVPKGGKYAAQVLRLVGYMAKGGKQAKALRTTLQGRKAQVDAVVKMAGSKDSRLKDAAPYMMGSLSLFASGRMPQQGEGTETLEQAASSEGAPAGDAEEPGVGDDMVAVVDLDSEKETMSELKEYIKNIIDNG